MSRARTRRVRMVKSVNARVGDRYVSHKANEVVDLPIEVACSWTGYGWCVEADPEPAERAVRAGGETRRR